MSAPLEAKFEPDVWLIQCVLLCRLQNNRLLWNYLACTCEQFLQRWILWKIHTESPWWEKIRAVFMLQLLKYVQILTV